MEEQDETMTFTLVDPLMEVKDEINVDNPWSVEHSSAFLKYCCPECEYKYGTFKSFEDHAFQNHENARILFPYEKHKKGEYKAETEFSGKTLLCTTWNRNKEKMLPRCFLTYTTQHNCLKKKVNSCDHCDMIFSTKPNLKSHVFTLAGTDLLCMLNWGTQWTMVSYLKK